MKASETKRKAVETLMEKYGLKKKDLFSFCICAVNFLEYWDEEGMIDVMYDCPEKYASCDSNNTRAVAGALKGEMESEEWDEIDQFIWYAEMVQDRLADYADDRDPDDYRFTKNFVDRFDRCYHREVIIPYILGTDIEKFNDAKWDERGYLNGIINTKNFEILNIDNSEEEERTKKYEEEKAENLKKEVEARKSHKDFSFLFITCVDISHLTDKLKKYNETYYPDRDLKVEAFGKGNILVVQTADEDLDKAANRIWSTVTGPVLFFTPDKGRMDTSKMNIKKISDVFENVPDSIKEFNPTHVLLYGIDM